MRAHRNQYCTGLLFRPRLLRVDALVDARRLLFNDVSDGFNWWRRWSRGGGVASSCPDQHHDILLLQLFF